MFLMAIRLIQRPVNECGTGGVFAMRPSRGAHEGGFTLIELMITISLLMVITTIVYASFSSVVTTIDGARMVAEELRFRQFLARSFSTNLSQTSGDWRPGAALREPILTNADAAGDEAGDEGEVVRFWLRGEDDRGPLGPKDSLTFTSAAPLLGNTALPGFLKEVRYEVEEAARDEELEFSDEVDEEALSNVLVVTETPVMTEPNDFTAGDLFEAPDSDALAELAAKIGYEPGGWSAPIRTLDFQYFDGEDWVEEWDSREEGRLPWSVRIRINFARAAEELEELAMLGLDLEENPDFEMVVGIPTGLGTTQEPPFYQRAVAGSRGGSASGGGFGGGDGQGGGSGGGGRKP